MTAGVGKGDVDTPALILDLDKFDRNARRLSASLEKMGVSWRPHTKAHKSPELALRQVSWGAIGVTCAKVSEAEVMVEQGIRNILIANELGTRTKFDRLAHLQNKAEVIVCVDHPVHIDLASESAVAANVEIPILVDVDIGLGRTGTNSVDLAVELARLAHSSRGLRFAGVFGYEGQLAEFWPVDQKRAAAADSIGRLVEAARAIERDGLTVEIVSCGSSGSHLATAEVEGVTEIQAGGACLMDLFYAEECHLAAQGYEFALSILATIVSRPTSDRVVVDAGFKTMSNRDGRMPRPVGIPGLEVLSLSAEHGTLLAFGAAQELGIGDRVEFIPDYSDMTTFRHDAFVAVRENRVVGRIPLLGRGQLT